MRKKLTLRVDTVRTLSAPTLRRVRGGLPDQHTSEIPYDCGPQLTEYEASCLPTEWTAYAPCV